MRKTYRKGAVGALMDEYERATSELVRILEGLSDEEYERVRDTETKDEDCRSIQTVTGHVIRAGRGYAGMLRDAWGIARLKRPPAPVARADARAELEAMLAYMAATLEGRWNLSEAEGDAMQIRSGWGPVYDFEQLFEHAIVHVLRHRRQIERFLGR
jgi:uncharacterized damage-inducible protein DinB